MCVCGGELAFALSCAWKIGYCVVRVFNISRISSASWCQFCSKLLFIGTVVCVVKVVLCVLCGVGEGFCIIGWLCCVECLSMVFVVCCLSGRVYVLLG